MTTTIQHIDLYWRPGCVFCTMLRGPLARTGLPVVEHNIWEDESAAARVREANDGNETVPTVIIGDQVLTNPSLGTVRKAVATHAPHLLPADS